MFAPIATAHFFAHVAHIMDHEGHEGKQMKVNKHGIEPVFDPPSGKGSLVAFSK